MSKAAEIATRILKMETALKETTDSLKWTSGPVEDSLKVVIPMMEDQLSIMKGLLDEVSSHKHYDLSGGR